jgi:hypothetical protein
MRNAYRFDLSDWLIHFFRRIDLESGKAPEVPENMGFGNVNEDTKWSALFMLRCAIRQGRLWATWSHRNGVRTIYGPNPAVCFTEMPLAAFLEAGFAREARGEAMSQFALVFPKKSLFRLGANPVIYGLDNRDDPLPSGKDGEKRIIISDLLPEREQYRYVTYNPGADRPVDWSHEREWRWPYRGDLTVFERELENYGIISKAEDFPGLDFCTDELHGMGVVVQTTEQAKWVTHDILALFDRGIVVSNHFKFILCASNFPADGRMREPAEVSRAIDESIIDLEPYYTVPQEKIDANSARFSEMVESIEKSNKHVESGEFGGAWLWLLDNTHELTRSLLYSGRVFVSKDRRYLASLGEFDQARGLRQREGMIRELSEAVAQEFGIECGYFSVLDSVDFDELPFYCDNHINNRMFYNFSWDEE